ncbi:MAG: metallophosphoesterase [Oscillospiraceae bacterium]|nr:metallophosphoesterase [Oscillospiraceae bacterium]
MKIKSVFLGAMVIIIAILCTACNGAVDTPYPLKSEENIHTIVLASDTQRYASGKTDVYNKMFESLVSDKEKYNIDFIVHTGDVVQQSESDDEWKVAHEAISKLSGQIPFGVTSGNHDQVNGAERFVPFQKYFGEDLYKDCDYFGESYEDFRAFYELITISDMNFVFVFIGDDPDIGAINFANDVFAKYQDRIGVLCTHKFMREDLSLDEMGEYMMENIVEKNNNVYMTICGHESSAGFIENEVNGRKVVSIIANYQDANNDGTMMYLQLDEKEKTITGISYSPISGSYTGYADKDNDQFRVNIPW